MESNYDQSNVNQNNKQILSTILNNYYFKNDINIIEKQKSFYKIN
jgi:hypothetical protein